MATINVIARITAGTHLKYGDIVKGRGYVIDEADFGEEIFERIEDAPDPEPEASQKPGKRRK